MIETLEKVQINTIYNEDCLEGMSRIPNKSVDMILTDPPYLHVKGGMKSKKFNVGTWNSDSYMVNQMSDFDSTQIFRFMDESKRVLKKLNMYIFCSKLQLIHYFEWISKQNKSVKYDLLVWDKVKYAMKSTKFYTSDIEYIVRVYENGVSLNKVMDSTGSKSDIKHYLKRQAFSQPRDKSLHATIKPIEMFENFLRVASNEGDTVLDCFMGSGTTAVACLNTNRNYIGFELDEQYHQSSLQRIEQHKQLLKEETANGRG